MTYGIAFLLVDARLLELGCAGMAQGMAQAWRRHGAGMAQAWRRHGARHDHVALGCDSSRAIEAS